MNVKLFWSNNPIGVRKAVSVFEDQINAWLRENPRIKVIDIKQFASAGIISQSQWFISIWYEERAD
jgi:hypothetical protein